MTRQQVEKSERHTHTNRERERQTDRQTERQRDRDRQTDVETERDRQTDTEQPYNPSNTNPTNTFGNTQKIKFNYK